jgi:uncharacterized membrane protein YebE (DUF533 family)
MIDVKQLNVGGILDQFVGSGLAGGMAGGALANVLMTKGGRKLAGSALQIGGLALLGGLAYKAWQNHQHSKPVGPEPAAGAPLADSGFLPAPSDAEGQGQLGLLLLRAMIAAAKADGQINVSETQHIFGEINRTEFSPEQKALLLQEIGRPLNLEALVQAVDTPQHAAEVYAASALVMGEQTAVERAYLAQLAQRLGIEPALAQQLQATVNDARRAQDLRAAV